MQALPISSGPPQFVAPPAYSTAPSTAAATADSSGTPAFAAVVHEALGRSASDPGSPTVRSFKSDSGSSAKKIPPSANGNTPASPPQAFLVSATLPIPISPLPVPLALTQSLTPSTASGAPQNIPASATQDSGATDPPKSSLELQAAANFAAPLNPLPLASAQTATSLPLLPLLSTAPAAAAEIESSSGTLPAQPSQPTSPAPAPANPSDDSPSLLEALPSLQTLPTSQPPPPATDPAQPIPSAQPPQKVPAPPPADPLSSLLQQVFHSQQPPPSVQPPTLAVASQQPLAPAPLEAAQVATKAALTSAALLGAHPATNNSQAASSKPALSEAKESFRPAIASTPASSDAAQSGSHDASSGGGTQNKPDSSPLPDASASNPHEAAGFSQILSATSISGADNSQSSSAPAPASLASAASLNDRGTVADTPAPQASALPSPAPSSPFHNADGATNPFVNSAKLLESANNSEMRVSMQTDNLGTIELRARVAGDQVGAAIMVEKRDAHSALAVELPALQQALSDKQLRVEQVFLFHGSFSSTSGGSGAPAQQGQRGSHSAPQALWESSAAGTPFLGASFEQSGIFDAQGRLSVRA